jgi:uncharacterized membrane protein
LTNLVLTMKLIFLKTFIDIVVNKEFMMSHNQKMTFVILQLNMQKKLLFIIIIIIIIIIFVMVGIIVFMKNHLSLLRKLKELSHKTF